MNWLALAPYLGIVAALAFGGFEYTVVKTRDAEISQMKADAAKAVAEAQTNADRLANELVIAQAQAMAVTETTKTVYVDRIKNVPVTSACPASPAVRAGLDGVHDIIYGGRANPPAGDPKALH